MSSCTRCRRHVHCLTTENVFHMNSEKTATITIMVCSVTVFVFLICTDYIQSYILLLFFSLCKALAIA